MRGIHFEGGCDVWRIPHAVAVQRDRDLGDHASSNWLFIILTLPVNIVTLGLFTLVINALMLYIVRAVVSGFQFTNFWSAFIGALIIAVVSTGLSHLFGR
jgi:hypothetical protein